MDNLINAVLSNYVPTVIILSLVIGIFIIALAGIIRNSGKHEDVARSNFMIKTVIVGFIMLFLSGAFVFTFHEVYMSNFYNNIAQNLSNNLPNADTINNTDILSSDVKDASIITQDARCVLVVVDTIDCIKKTINDVIGLIISKFVRGVGVVLSEILQKFNFNFLFRLPVEVFDATAATSSTQATQVVNFNSLLKLSEIIGLAWVYILIVTHYFKSILFSLDNDYSGDFVGDMGKMLLGFAGVFLARYMAEAIITTAQAFASFLFSTPLANGLTVALKALISDGLWMQFVSFNITMVALAIFVLIYIILFGFIIFRNAKRYFILLVMILLAPIFTPMLFFDMTRNMGMIFWNKLIVTSFGLTFDLIILLMIFVFLGSGGLSLGNLILMLVGMAIIADSNNLLQQIAMASEVSNFRSVVRKGFSSGVNSVYRWKRFFGQ
ncbi:MAG: hypothetical protein A2817_01755 [Candidatus Yanofskybacteria bacterium RIFCSPHIGHO2_01_FULL_39_8b]|uniref:Uncharacterized protein n=1 Tax=Candidatus Yanofskybacteria bacterium RIFCSPHIGHO2_01_FULL_39_8b TaxID=1802659 RepID=A0A1F8EAL9_9BACT|nr:MAG: hypothetical protein A2817_01755 [Candidatus Yanofskybacteria bacterium RIFCSPHIGHO2_01_FULL_39_8b]